MSFHTHFNNSHSRFLLFWLWLIFLGAPALTQAQVPSTPNFIIIFADDLGYGDLGCYGHPSIRTPNLDRMAAEGMRFTDFYSCAEVCTPSRAGLMTGRLPIRSGMAGDKRRVLFQRSKGGLPKEEVTIAEGLKAKQYATICIGKWHLGVGSEHHPKRHGFDTFFGLPYSNDMGTRTNVTRGRSGSLTPNNDDWDVPLIDDERESESTADQSTLTKRYTSKAVDFIQRHRERPFFIYLAHTFPHVPLFASSDFKGKSARGLYGDVVEELDWSVGQILGELRKTGLDRKTLVVFTSDNGPWLIQGLAGGSAGLLREGKGSTWEGGMRVPGLAWWPGKVPSGVVTRAMASNLDLFPTFLSLAGIPAPEGRILDGVDLSELLLGKATNPRDTFFFYRGLQLFAVRKGSHKAHFMTRSGYGRDAMAKHDPPLLFHLGHDPGESFNVASEHPAILDEINGLVDQHQKTLRPVVSQVDE